MIAKYDGDTSLARNGGCSLCSRVENLVTTDDVIEGEGLYVLCRGCVNDLAVAAGFVVNETAKFLEQAIRISELEEALLVTEHERADTQAKLDQLRDQWVAAVERASLDGVTA